MGILAGKLSTEARADGKTIVITGANTGIGLETAAELYARGGRVVLACRNMEKGKQAKKEILERYSDARRVGELFLVRLDLSSLTSVRAAAKEILDSYSRLDVLINNAGVLWCPYTLTEDGYELQFATNHLGHFLLTMLLLPRILKTASSKSSDDPSRIVNLSSVAHGFIRNMYFEDINLKQNYNPFNAYYRSKAANVFFTKSLAKRLEGKNVKVYAVHPGIVDTAIWRHTDSTVFPGTRWLIAKIGSWFIKTPTQGAATSLYCTLDKNSSNESGLYYSDCAVKTPSNFVQNEEIAEHLFNISIEMVHLNPTKFDPFVPEVDPPANRKKPVIP